MERKEGGREIRKEKTMWKDMEERKEGRVQPEERKKKIGGRKEGGKGCNEGRNGTEERREGMERKEGMEGRNGTEGRK